MTLRSFETRTGHKPYVCEQPCTNIFCKYCEGGLFLCVHCGGAEGSLLPTCPRRQLTYEEHDINYRHYCNKTGPWAPRDPMPTWVLLLILCALFVLGLLFAKVSV